MRSTYYIKEKNLEKLNAAAEILGISNDELLAILLTRVCHANDFTVKPFRAIKYQKKDPSATWFIEHIRFMPIVYEKVQDLKRNFKFSVSWLISFCINNLLASVVAEYSQKGQNEVVNYKAEFTFMSKMFGDLLGFITIWGKPDPEELKKPLI